MKCSIYIPVFNTESLITRTLDSIPRRDDIEVIVCDDGSSDSSLDVLMDYKEKNDLKMRVMWNPRNMGCGYTCNILLNVCKGEYVYELDADDALFTDEWEKALDELDGTDLVYVCGKTTDGNIIRVNPENKFYYCAPWLKFVRRAYLGEVRFPVDKAQPDFFYNNDLQEKEHTEKYTDLVVYDYNFPREGSITWKAMHSSSTT